MASIVGTKGQVVIEKELRDQLGIKPGWKAYQRIVDGRIELSFLPPEHNRSLKGILRSKIRPEVIEQLEGMDWQQIREMAWAAAAEERMRRMEEADEEDGPSN